MVGMAGTRHRTIRTEETLKKRDIILIAAVWYFFIRKPSGSPNSPASVAPAKEGEGGAVQAARDIASQFT